MRLVGIRELAWSWMRARASAVTVAFVVVLNMEVWDLLVWLVALVSGVEVARRLALVIAVLLAVHPALVMVDMVVVAGR